MKAELIESEHQVVVTMSAFEARVLACLANAVEWTDCSKAGEALKSFFETVENTIELNGAWSFDFFFEKAEEDDDDFLGRCKRDK